MAIKTAIALLFFSVILEASPVFAVYERIISLYPAHTENLVQLGAADQLIGISTSDDYPESIKEKPRFSYREDAEKFIAAKPDLILIRPMIARSYPQFIEKMERAGITVISLQPNKVEELFQYWRELGTISGHQLAAEKMITDFQQEIDNIKKATLQLRTTHHLKKPNVFFETMHSKARTIATESIAAFVLDAAGGENIATDATQIRMTNIAYYPKEKLLEKGIEIDFFIAQVGRMNPINKSVIVEEPGYGAIKAVREGNILLVPEELVSRPTFRIVEGVRLINETLYPELKK